VSRPDIALISPYPARGRHGGDSGVASYTANLAHSLSAEGARTMVVAPVEDAGSAGQSDGPVSVTRAFRKGARAIPGAANAALESGAPIVHLQHELFLYGGPSALPGLLWGLRTLRSRRPGVVVTAHQVVDPAAIYSSFTRLHRVGVPPVAARAGFKAIQSTLSKLAARVVVHERSFADVIPGAAVVPHGVEEVTRVPRDAARAALGLKDRFTALAFGFVAPYKGLEPALEAAELAGPEIELVVAGGPHPRVEERDSYAGHLRRRWAGTARFTGYVGDGDVPNWFSAADVVLLPYPRPHASSGALALALAYGAPFLVSPELGRSIGAPSEAVSSTSPDQLAARLQELARDSVALSRTADACRSMAAGRSWSSVARRHLEIYEEVWSGNDSRSRWDAAV
jgi:glycosyltransferase involved in cell wall biosynthesis